MLSDTQQKVVNAMAEGFVIQEAMTDSKYQAGTHMYRRTPEHGYEVMPITKATIKVLRRKGIICKTREDLFHRYHVLTPQ